MERKHVIGVAVQDMNLFNGNIVGNDDAFDVNWFK